MTPPDPKADPRTACSWRTTGESQTEEVGAELARRLEADDGVLLLVGPMGAGKTVLVRGMGGHLGVDRRQVLSPTYNLIHEYEGTHGRLVHVDLYRLDAEEDTEAGDTDLVDPAALDGLGLEELLAGPGVKAVEWAERLPFELPGAHRVELRDLGGGVRDIVWVD